MTNQMTIGRCVAFTFVATLTAVAWAQHSKPLPHPVGVPQRVSSGPSGALAPSVNAAVRSWTPLVNQPSFLVDGASAPVLLTAGTVLIQDAGFPDWWKLTPDSQGSYVNGTWSQVASL